MNSQSTPSSKSTITLTGIIIHSQPIFERDRLIELITPDQGKLKLLSKSGQKRYAGHTQIGNWIEATVYQRSSIPLITECHIKQSFSGIRTHFNRLSLMGYMLSMTRLSTAFHQPNANLFDLLKTSLSSRSFDSTPIHYIFSDSSPYAYA